MSEDRPIYHVLKRIVSLVASNPNRHMAKKNTEGVFMFQGNVVTHNGPDPKKSGNSLVTFQGGHTASVPSSKIDEVTTSKERKAPTENEG